MNDLKRQNDEYVERLEMQNDELQRINLKVKDATMINKQLNDELNEKTEQICHLHSENSRYSGFFWLWIQNSIGLTDISNLILPNTQFAMFISHWINADFDSGYSQIDNWNDKTGFRNEKWPRKWKSSIITTGIGAQNHRFHIEIAHQMRNTAEKVCRQKWAAESRKHRTGG